MAWGDLDGAQSSTLDRRSKAGEVITMVTHRVSYDLSRHVPNFFVSTPITGDEGEKILVGPN